MQGLHHACTSFGHVLWRRACRAGGNRQDRVRQGFGARSGHLCGALKNYLQSYLCLIRLFEVGGEQPGLRHSDGREQTM